MNKYPEHEKLKRVREKSQACGEFIDWLQERGISLASRHEHNNECVDPDSGYFMCGACKGELLNNNNTPIRRLLAEFFEIDEEKLEAEKQAMLAELRAGQP